MRAAVLVGALGALLACRENIPRPPDDPEDAGTFNPADVSSPDAPPVAPDATVDTEPPPTCGLPGQGCCPGNVCAGGGCCMSGLCVANGTACRADATCLDGSCGGCGALTPLPQPCCEPRMCTASRTVCLGVSVGTCQPCGGSAQPCCGDGFCQSGFTCDKVTSSQGLCVAK